MMRLFAVRNRKDNLKFASKEGWAPFGQATIFQAEKDEVIETFRRGLDENAEMVEIGFVPVTALASTLN